MTKFRQTGNGVPRSHGSHHGGRTDGGSSDAHYERHWNRLNCEFGLGSKLSSAVEWRAALVEQLSCCDLSRAPARTPPRAAGGFVGHQLTVVGWRDPFGVSVSALKTEEERNKKYA